MESLPLSFPSSSSPCVVVTPFPKMRIEDLFRVVATTHDRLPVNGVSFAARANVTTVIDRNPSVHQRHRRVLSSLAGQKQRQLESSFVWGNVPCRAAPPVITRNQDHLKISYRWDNSSPRTQHASYNDQVCVPRC